MHKATKEVLKDFAKLIGIIFFIGLIFLGCGMIMFPELKGY